MLVDALVRTDDVGDDGLCSDGKGFCPGTGATGVTGVAIAVYRSILQHINIVLPYFRRI